MSEADKGARTPKTPQVRPKYKEMYLAKAAELEQLQEEVKAYQKKGAFYRLFNTLIPTEWKN